MLWKKYQVHMGSVSVDMDKKTGSFVWFTVENKTSCSKITHKVVLILYISQFISGDSNIYDVNKKCPNVDVFVIWSWPMT